MVQNGSAQEVKDRWVHRSSEMKCKTCMWWVRKGEIGSSIGRCRRRAPTLNGWPVAFADDWCGDHKLTETGNL